MLGSFQVVRSSYQVFDGKVPTYSGEESVYKSLAVVRKFVSRYAKEVIHWYNNNFATFVVMRLTNVTAGVSLEYRLVIRITGWFHCIFW